MKNEEIIAGTLKWCNERRKDQSQYPLEDLPKGQRGDGYSCPCGEACGYFVGRAEYWPHDGWGAGMDPLGELPKVVKEFVELFDTGKFPQYDKYARMTS